MSFLAPLALLFGLLSGFIILMYLLKLRRRREVVSSTLLWVRTVEDLVANAPFQKLRQNLLMYLQILMLLLLAVALARPMMWLTRGGGRSHVLIIDNSASMSARDGDPEGSRSRLQAAQAAARELVGNMTRGDQAMVIAIGGSAQVMTPFTDEKATLHHAINSIEPTDAPAAIQEALRLAQGVRQIDEHALVTVLSDGGLGHLGNLVAKEDPIQFFPFGSTGENCGLIAFDIREAFDRRGQAQAFVEARNFGEGSATFLLRCLIDGNLVQAQEATIPAGERQGFTFTELPGGNERRLIRIEIDRADALPADNAVQGYYQLDSATHILLVSSGNFFLERMLSLLPEARVSRVAPAEFSSGVESAAATASAGGSYDLVVFDQFSPPALGPGSYLFINAIPPVEGFTQGEGALPPQMILDWNRLHPVTRFVQFDELATGEALDLTLPDWAVTLVESAQAPLIVAGEHQGLRLIVIGFDLFASEWPLQVSYPLFMANATEWLVGAGRGDLSASQHRTGETIRLAAPREVTSLRSVQVTGPDGGDWDVLPSEDGSTYFTHALRTGVYEARLDSSAPEADDVRRPFAVNLLSPGESDIAPKQTLLTGERQIAASTVSRENREIWPWFALLGLGVLMMEWHLYCRRSWV